MAVKCVVMNVAGRLYSEERDADTNALLRRVPMGFDTQPLKARLRLELEDAIDDLMRVKDFLDYATAKGDVPLAQITAARASLEAALYQRTKDVFQEWRNA